MKTPDLYWGGVRCRTPSGWCTTGVGETLVSVKFRFIFVHVPKAGGTTAQSRPSERFDIPRFVPGRGSVVCTPGTNPPDQKLLRLAAPLRGEVLN